MARTQVLSDCELYSLYGGRVQLKFYPGSYTPNPRMKHIYEISIDGKEPVIAPGVTGITGVLNKPALQYWAADLSSKWWLEKLSGGALTTTPDRKSVIKVDGKNIVVPTIDEILLSQGYEEARKSPQKASKEAADIGTLAHAWVESHIKFLLGWENYPNEPERPINAMAAQAVEAFLDWEKQHQVEYIESEQPLYSIENNFAGTLDIIAKVDGELCLVDIKTSSGIYDEMILQTAAYQGAYQEERGTKLVKRWILRIGKLPKEVINDAGVKELAPDFEAVPFDNFEADYEGYLGCLVVRRHLDRLKGELSPRAKTTA